MLIRNIITRRLFCTKAKDNIKKAQVKLIQVKVLYDGELFKYNFPIMTKLALNLQKARVPLQFECGFGCSCGTCPVVIQNKSQFEMIKNDQPHSQAQIATIRQNSYDMQNTRLSCQLYVMEYFKDITFKIQ